MNTKKLVFGAAAAAGLLALGSLSFAAAQSADGPPRGPESHGPMTGHEQMGNHAQMAEHGPMSGQGSEQHTQMHADAAAALGVTVDELDALFESGKTISDIAAEKGVDLDTFRTTMQASHATGHGAGMTHGAMNGTN